MDYESNNDDEIASSPSIIEEIEGIKIQVLYLFNVAVNCKYRQI